MSEEPDEAEVAPAVRTDFPDLRLWTRAVTLAGPPGRRSPKDVRDHLKALAQRLHGARAIQQRTEPVVRAHRVFFRHVGLDPDADESRTPAEELTLTRLKKGGLASHGPVADALTVALAETGVGVWALDAATVRGPLELREARAGESMGRGELVSDAAPRRLVIADAEGPLAVLFRDPAAPHLPGPATAAVLLYAVQVPHVPRVHVEEALWLAASTLDPRLDG
ncbi:MAG TPA: hypothetical protein VN238_08560 [Solirubrobacteraceae bacterium]|nr:hypothetical protein [Solirubrobacteraceae bacterium]